MPKQSLLTGAAALLASQAVVLVLGYGSHLWIGRQLGPAAYGIFGLVLSVQTIIGLILTLGIPTGVARFVAQDETHAYSILRQALRIQLTIGLFLTVGGLALSPLLAHLLGDARLVPYLQFVSVAILFQAAYPVFNQYFSGLHNFNKQAVLTTLYALTKFAGAIGLLYFWHVYGAFAGFALGGLAATVVGWYWTRDHRTAVGTKLHLKNFLAFAGVYVLTLLGLQILISLDLFMVKAILKSDVQAGYYNAAVTLSRISYQLLQTLSFVLLPSVSALTRHDGSREKAVLFIRDALRYLGALIIPSVVLAAVTSRSLISLFFSTHYVAAAPVLSLLMVGVGSLGFYSLLVSIIAGAGRPRITVYITVLLIGTSAVIGYVLIPLYGLTGAALQTTIAGLLGLIILSVYTFRSFGITFPVASLVRIFVATALAVAPTLVWHVAPVFLPFQYAVVGILYCGLLYLLGEVRTEDLHRIGSAHPRLRFLQP
jgi:stage V sporulation protein B